MNDPYTLHTLSNGLRIVIESMPDVRSAAAGFLVLTGARHDPPTMAGVSHFLEHMMFKGTARRTWRDITVDFDRMGSSYNAYTSEDRTIYYGWVPDQNIAKQIELLSDMIRSTIPNEEFDTEKNVVLEEIAMSKDNLEHVAFDFLQEKVFAGHPLAWPILGYEQTVQALTRDQMHDYFQSRYAPANMMLIVAGKVDPAGMIAQIEDICGGWPTYECNGAKQTVPTIHTGKDVLQLDRFEQQIVALTFPAIDAVDAKAETASAAAAILGGDNSRFYWNIIQNGIAPRAGAYHLDYSDCGLMILYGSCEPNRAESLVDAMRKDADTICNERVEERELDRVKNKRRTALAAEAEAPYHRLSQIMDDMQFRGAPRTVEQMLAEVDAISLESIHDYFQEFPISTDGHLTSVGPRHWP